MIMLIIMLMMMLRYTTLGSILQLWTEACDISQNIENEAEFEPKSC